MDSILVALAAAVGLFAGTNVDDMVVLAVLNVSARAEGRPKPWQIWAGQYAGIAVLVAISLLAALGLALVPDGWLWLLGLVPLLLGVRKLVIAIRAARRGETVPAVVATGLPGVIGLTIANGGDNIAAYTPVFRAISSHDTAVTLAVFTVGVAVWCLAGSWLVSHHTITEMISRWGQWIIPAVFPHRPLRLPQGRRPQPVTAATRSARSVPSTAGRQNAVRHLSLKVTQQT